MKAFLLSHNIGQKHIDLFKKIIGQPKVSKALFITTAAVPYGFDPKPEWLSESLESMSQFAETVDETSLEAGEYMPNDLSQYDFIFVSGGNTFYLAYRLAKIGLDKKIKEYINNEGVFSGSSAGSIILMDSIEHFAPADDPSKAPKIYSGLGLIDFAVIPHAKSEKYGLVMDKIAEKYKAEGIDVIPIDDNQVLVINNGNKEII